MRGNSNGEIIMEIILPETIRRASKADWKQIRDITANAFSQDPFNLWIFGNARPLKALFGGFAKDIYLKNGFCHISGDEAATMWTMPGVNIDPPAMTIAKLALAQKLYGSKGSIARGMASGEAMERGHPEEPHIYLFTVAVRQSAQGKGLGKTLLSPVFEAADRSNLPIYLENTNPQNNGFYNSLGFEKTGELDLSPDAPIVSKMWRTPRLTT